MLITQFFGGMKGGQLLAVHGEKLGKQQENSEERLENHWYTKWQVVLCFVLRCRSFRI